jgi:hypothetical protein
MKTKICASAILLVVSLASNRAQDTWTQKADFGGVAREGATGFSIGNKGYIGLGAEYPISYKDFWEYDPDANTWTQKADFGGHGRLYAVGFTIAGKGYVGTGQSGTFPNYTYYKDFWEYDPNLNTWTRKSDFGGTARYGAVGFSIDNKGYLGTGVDASLIDKKDFWEFDPIQNIWTQKTDFGGTERKWATGLTIGAKGYVGTGGHDILFKDFWEYDPSTNTWVQKADFGGSARQVPASFGIGNKGYIGTGENENGSLKDFWEFDPTSNTWSQKSDFRGGKVNQATGFSIGSNGYIGTGVNVSSYRKDFWEYTPEGASSYRDVILADNPIMYWRLGEAGGKIAYDETANHRDATYMHQPTHGLDGAIANDPNTSVRFNGFCQWVGWIPTSSYSGEFTVEAWVREEKVFPIETFFNTRAATSDFSFDFKFDELAEKEIRFDIGDGTQWLSTSALPFNFQPHVWYYVAAVVTTNGATYYVDGSALGSVTYNGTPLLFDAIHKVEIGFDTGLRMEGFHGAIDEVAVYDYALTADQIAAHYATGTGN